MVENLQELINPRVEGGVKKRFDFNPRVECGPFFLLISRANCLTAKLFHVFNPEVERWWVTKD